MAFFNQRARRWLTRGVLSVLGLVLLGTISLATLEMDSPVPQVVHNTSVFHPDGAPFRAGWGRAKLTPTLHAQREDPHQGAFQQVPLAGFGNRHGAPALGIHDDIWIKAVAFASRGTTGVMVMADALIIPRDIADRTATDLERSHGLRREQIYFSASHTHCSIGGWGQRWIGEAFAGPFGPGIPVWFSQQLTTAARLALADLQPAELGQGSFQAPELIRNRLVGDRGEVDPEFSLLVLRKAQGDRAVLGSFSAHATVLGGGVMQVSADYPGAWQRAVEASGIQWAGFLSGAVGSQGPRAPTGGWDGVEAMGRVLSDKTLRQLPSIPMRSEVVFGIGSAEIELPDAQVRLTDSVRLRPWISRQLMPPLSRSVLLQAFWIGNQNWLSTPCDYSGELALELKRRARSTGRHTVVTSFNGDYVGYVIPTRYYHMEGYEPRTMNFYGSHLSEVFTSTLDRLASLEAR